MLGYKINSKDVKLIEKVNFLKTEFTETVCNIYVNVTMTYGLNEYFLVGKVYKDYKTQGNYSCINGIEKEYKTVKPVLNSIMKYYNSGLEYDKILIYVGLKKDIKETRIYKKLIKTQDIKETKKNNIEVVTIKKESKSIDLSYKAEQENINPTITELPQEPSKVKYKNNIIESVEDAEIRSKLYKSLEQGDIIGYTNNLRGIPHASYSNEGKRLYIIINPNEYQRAYVDKYIYSISEAVRTHYKGFEDELKNLYYSNYEEFKEVITEDGESEPLNQYYYRDIIKYLRRLYRVEQEQKSA